MSDPRASFDDAFGRDTSDPVSSLIAAVRDAWTVGLSALQAIAQQAGAGAAAARPDQEAVADPLSTLIGMSASFAASLNDLVVRRAEFGSAAVGPPGSHDHPRDGDLSSLMMQTWMICATSMLRYWQDLTDVYARHQPALIQVVARRATPRPSTPEAEDRLLADKLRACLREIGDVAVQEARRLETELERVSEAVAREFDQPGASEFYQRRWKAKD